MKKETCIFFIGLPIQNIWRQEELEKKNPIKGDNRPMRIVKKQEKDSKARFSYFEIDLKDGVDVSYPEIKVMGDNKK